jgi:hypothetical protein
LDLSERLRDPPAFFGPEEISETLYSAEIIGKTQTHASMHHEVYSKNIHSTTGWAFFPREKFRRVQIEAAGK